MKKLALVALVLFTGVVAFSQGSRVTGFRNLVWGTHLDSAMRDGKPVKFKKDREAKEANAYMIPGEEMKIGAAKLNSINYFFNEDDRFNRVVAYGDTTYYADMSFIVRHKFGSPTERQLEGTLEILTWREGDVSLRLTKDTKNKLFSFSIKSNWDRSKSLMTNMRVKDFKVNEGELVGFRGLRWLQKKDEIRMNGEKLTFVLDREAPTPNTYFLPNDVMLIGTARLTGISYIFNDDDKLIEIVITGDIEYYDEMKLILDSKFGKADGTSDFSGSLNINTWSLKASTVKLSTGGDGKGFKLILKTNKGESEDRLLNMNADDF